MHKCNKPKDIVIVPNVINLKILLLFMLKKVYTEFFFLYMSKRETKKLMTNSNLIDKKGIL